MLQISEFKLFSNQKILLEIPQLTLDIASFIYLKGENASGKTLLLKTLSNQYTNWSGNILFKKQPLSYHTKKNYIVMINNELPVIKEQTFLENILIPLGRFTDKQKNKLLEMATIFEIIDLINVKMQFSSTSERLMMYLIRTALINPTMLLIDDFDCYFDANNLPKALEFIQYCLKSGMLVIASGKARLNDITSFKIKSGELVKL